MDGFQGQGLVNTFLGGDGPQGRLTSPLFTINRRFICFLIGGGNDAKTTCINLLVDGQIVRTATGRAAEQLAWHNWNVAELEGKEARIEIVDHASGPWGHVNVDQIELSDRAHTADDGPLETQPDFGTMALSLLGDQAGVLTSHSLPHGPLPENLFAGDKLADDGQAATSLGGYLCGALGRRFELAPGGTTTLVFLITWHFANRPESGHYYASRFADAGEVARYVAENFDRLASQTRLWVDTYYDSTLPYWLLDRIHSTVSTLATSTCEIWKNGRFWAYEGVRCCHGTCGHVWNYEHALARLFPQLERTVREMQDFNPEAGFVEETGMIRFRGELAGVLVRRCPDRLCSEGLSRASDQLGQCLPASETGRAIRKALEFLLAGGRRR